MFLRFFFPRALYEPNTIVNIGFPSSFQLGVSQQFLQSNRIWVVVEPGRLFVIFARCTHLGCTPDWLPQEDMFHCPCHGSEYDPEGSISRARPRDPWIGTWSPCCRMARSKWTQATSSRRTRVPA
jgi:nitrite reductase/ring-hydroxylating ferredoxin subunit